VRCTKLGEGEGRKKVQEREGEGERERRLLRTERELGEERDIHDGVGRRPEKVVKKGETLREGESSREMYITE